ncbi:MAG: hypothetical protein WDZ29_06050 [Balneolaceae bacterium]
MKRAYHSNRTACLFRSHGSYSFQYNWSIHCYKQEEPSGQQAVKLLCSELPWETTNTRFLGMVNEADYLFLEIHDDYRASLRVARVAICNHRQVWMQNLEVHSLP